MWISQLQEKENYKKLNKKIKNSGNKENKKKRI